MATKTIRRSETRGSEPEWTAIERSADFRSLVTAKMRFIIPATLFFVVYYFALPVLVGYVPGLMERKVVGQINVAYLFALSQFAMTWIIMALYVAKARGFDADEARIVAKIESGSLR